MAGLDLNGMSEDVARKHLVGMLNELNAASIDANDEKIVWVENANGRRDVIPYGYWRKFEQKHAHETGMRLLDPDEIDEEEAKCAQGAIAKAERERLMNADVVEMGDLQALRDKVAELEAQVSEQPKGKKAS